MRRSVRLILLAALAISCRAIEGPPPVEPDLPLDASPESIADMAASDAPRRAAEQIEELLAAADDESLRIALAPGHYWLRARPYIDPTCGNCEDPGVEIEATAGLVVSGREIELFGAASADDVIVHTGAGYGIVFDGCTDCSLRSVTVTDGVRDSASEATSAAVLVRHADVLLDGIVVRDNVGDSAVLAETVAGIIGVAGREGADFTLVDSRILGNSWDGVALYRDARATIRNSVIDGVDAATGATPGGGRGVGIGLTWNARATVEGNLVTRYWKGIGVFVDAEAEIRENVVEDVLTWGIVLWDADKGTPRAVIERNAVIETGACGINLHDTGEVAEEPGSLRENLVLRTGQNPRYDSGEPYCEQTAIARAAVPRGFAIEGNVLADNREPGDVPGRDDVAKAELPERAAPIIEALRAHDAAARSVRLDRYLPTRVDLTRPD